jgi:spore germination protein GerM
MAGRRALQVVIVATALAVGCGDDGDTTPTTATTPTTQTATSDPTDTTTAPTDTTTPVGSMIVQVFFVDEDAFNVGRPPYVVPVERESPAGEDPVRVALDELFAGPTADESAGGLVLVASEATGIAELRVEDGTAHVTLAGGCSSGGSTLTVAESIMATLRQFAAIQAVKIYDPEGETQAPDSPGDSVPECLEP